MLKRLCHGACIAICLIMASGASAPGGPPQAGLSQSMRYAPPEATFNAANQLQLLQDEINQKQLPAAATRLDALLRDSADLLMGESEDGSVLSVSAWVANLPSETKNLLRAPYESAEGPAAQQAVEDVQAKPGAQPADFYTLARRYPLARAALAALAEGARRSTLLGDVPTARWMLNSATTGGWLADPALAHELDQSPPSSTGYIGALPFEASWYQSKTRQAWASLRSFPSAAGDYLFIVGPGQVIAMKENGVILWQGPAGAQPGTGQVGQGTLGATSVTRGPPFAPAVLCDVSGAPQLLVVRQPEVHGNGWALRAMRADDGHLLWTTEGADDFRGLVFGSNPAIEGRYVYAVAGEVTDQLDHLWLVALEVTTGRQLWRCDIGTESRTIMPHARNQSGMGIYRPWLNETAPAVEGDQVIAAPDLGAVIAVGRFDGKLRWTRGYQTLADPTLFLQRQRDFAIAHPASIPPLPPGLSLRWANTPAVSGDVVVSAPEDSDQVIALNIHDGKPLWQSADLPQATLIGIGGGNAVFADQKVTGLDLAAGKTAWTYADEAVRGPAVIRGDLVLAPTTDGLTVLSAQNGSVVPGVEKVPNFEKAIATEAVHVALVANDVARCFAATEQKAEGRRQKAE
jgi:outer membrane protein assembly factor BamB